MAELSGFTVYNGGVGGENVDKLPKLKMYDEIESDGSILLFDASEIDETQSVENDAYLKNIFSENCSKICGDSNIKISIKTSGDVKLEKTSKNAIHEMWNPNAQSSGANLQYAFINVIGGIKEYLKNNKIKNDFYLSAWIRFTSLDEGYGEAKMAYPISYTSPGNYNNFKVFYASVLSDEINITDAHYIKMSCHKVDDIASAGSSNMSLMNIGPANLNNVGLTAGRIYGSTILYRFYIEDLTVSGRTKEEVQIIDEKLFNEAFAEGGKFYNDTWTDPKTAFTE
ncbi:MAG: hypothetical protein ACLR02_08110 [Clostridium sp.]